MSQKALDHKESTGRTYSLSSEDWLVGQVSLSFRQGSMDGNMEDDPLGLARVERSFQEMPLSSQKTNLTSTVTSVPISDIHIKTQTERQLQIPGCLSPHGGDACHYLHHQLRQNSRGLGGLAQTSPSALFSPGSGINIPCIFSAQAGMPMAQSAKVQAGGFGINLEPFASSAHS